ncbi:hypothetical protein [Bradyrhizobium sp. DASA03120]|uniref:hypothetical protein n=1 Tax=Bradyrhizobium sp. SMVTL-02 TaxID=3395917 RepID=UPI003F72C64A
MIKPKMEELMSSFTSVQFEKAGCSGLEEGARVSYEPEGWSLGQKVCRKYPARLV